MNPSGFSQINTIAPEMRTYSSVKEVMESGLFDQRRMNNNNTNNGNGSVSVREHYSASTNRRRSSFSRASSFTTGVEPGRRRISEVDSRVTSFNSSFASIDEDSAVSTFTHCERICLSSSPPPTEEIDLAEMTTDEFNSLKKSDPFMYHSIPEVHKRSFKFDEGAIDLAQLLEPDDDDDDDDDLFAGGQEGADAGAGGTGAAAAGGTGPRRRMRPRLSTSCPAGLLADADIARAMFERTKVIKRRRLSVEAHPSLVCEDMLMGEILNNEQRHQDHQGDNEAAVAAPDTAEERLLEALMSTSLGLDDDSDSDEEDFLGF